MSASDEAKALPAEAVSADVVDAYLRRHPEFLDARPALLAALVPPAFDRGGGVIDMQRFLVQRLKSDLAQLRSRERALLTAAEANAVAQARVLAAARALLAARSFQHLIRVVVDDLPAMLDVTATAIAVENGERMPGNAGDTGVTVLKPGTVEALVGTERPIRLRPAADEDRALFGAAGAAVRSVALMRLEFGPGAPAGLCALGSAAPDGFEAGQSTDLLGFFAHVLQLCIRRWLGLAT